MRLLKVGIENYKCFFERQTLELQPGFNLLVGANNSGKTTLLEVLDIKPGLSALHRSQKSMPSYGATAAGSSTFEIDLSTNVAELLANTSRRQIRLAVPRSVGDTQRSPEQIHELGRTLLLADEFVLKLRMDAHGDQVTLSTPLGVSEVASRQNPNAPLVALQLTVDAAGALTTAELANFGGVSSETATFPFELQRLIYRFAAHRRPASESGHNNSVLDRDAGNLAYCVNHMQTNDAHGHRHLCELVSQVLPSVRWVQAPPINNGFQLQCLPLPPESRRDDLAVPISQMGTGIGNVIAMLYVVLTARTPQVIAIDEPNSFLHPKALRALLHILAAEGPQHQYILTAHSADVLTAVAPKAMALFEFDGASTCIKQAAAGDIGLMRSGLAELGVRITDLHGRDQVLWVEGQTEELVVPTLLQHFCPKQAAGVAVLRVDSTGSFSRRRGGPMEMAKIYQRLSISTAFVPPLVSILLDAEGRDAETCKALERESDGVLRCLPRRMLENYLLDPEAVGALLRGWGEEVSIQQVASALCSTLHVRDVSEIDLDSIDGATAIAAVVSTLTDARHEFRKTRDVPTLVGWMLDHRRAALEEVGAFLRSMVEPATATAPS